VKNLTTPQFWNSYNKLHPASKETADKNFKLLKENPSHPSLHFKKVGSYWSVRIGIKNRALAVEHEGNLLWFWIGSHAEYDKLLENR